MKFLTSIMQALAIPLLVLNVFGVLGSMVWLMFLGRWAALGAGMLGVIGGSTLIGIAMLPGILLAAPAMYLEKKGQTAAMAMVGFMSVGYTTLVLTIWATAVFTFFSSRASSISSQVALLVFSNGVANAPIVFLAQKDQQNEYSALNAFFAQLAYALCIALAILIGLRPLGVFLVFGTLVLVGGAAGLMIARSVARQQIEAASAVE